MQYEAKDELYVSCKVEDSKVHVTLTYKAQDWSVTLTRITQEHTNMEDLVRKIGEVKVVLADVLNDIPIVKGNVYVAIDGDKITTFSIAGTTKQGLTFSFQENPVTPIYFSMASLTVFVAKAKRNVILPFLPTPEQNVKPNITTPPASRVMEYLSNWGLDEEESCAVIQMAAENILASRVPTTHEDFEAIFNHLKSPMGYNCLNTILSMYAKAKNIAYPETDKEYFSLLKMFRNEFFNTFRHKIKASHIFEAGSKSTQWETLIYYFLKLKFAENEFPSKLNSNHLYTPRGREANKHAQEGYKDK